VVARNLICGRCTGALLARKAGNSLCHGTTGDVDKGVVSACSLLSSCLLSRKSPECNADLGLSISSPAASLLKPSSTTLGLFGDSFNSTDGRSAKGELFRGESLSDACSGVLLPKPFLNDHEGEPFLLILSISSPRLIGLSSLSSDGTEVLGFGSVCVRLLAQLVSYWYAC
jgi:hypothetical protein